MGRLDRIAGAALALLGVVVLWESRRLPFGTLHHPGPAYLPVMLALALVVFGVLVALFGVHSPRLRETDWAEWRHAVAIFAVCAFAAWGLERMGYRLTMGLAAAFLLGVVERKGVIVSLGVALLLAAGTFYLFNTLLLVPLPRGPFGW
ncbi:MAG TPA: tripartite tricarboxylate transporter TctB family protein [Methylomirabilota bacterium]|jgi:hypothetical protein|nr:tripartite tricarboxylate transporter TctB family protein [Methylomirabilota bacterium]